MSKKIIYVLIVLVVIIAVAVAVYFLTTQNQQEGDNANNVTIDLQALNTTLSSQPPFNEMATMDITMETLNTMYQITADEVEAVIGKMPMMNVKASMYAILKPTNGKAEEVKAQMETYLTSYEEQWATYLPDQYELVKNRAFEEINGYLVYVISEDNEAFLNVVRQALQ